MAKDNKVLIVGLSAIDIIIQCDQYPKEDEKGKALLHYKQRGGNAANIAEVIACLGSETYLFSYLEKGENGSFVLNQLNRRNVKTEHCIFLDQPGFPTTYCILSKAGGSRTTLHSRSPAFEPKYDDFLAAFSETLHHYSWIHLEGRGFPDVCKISQFLQQRKQEARHANCETRLMPIVSAELERIASKNDLLVGVLPFVDVLFVSKDFAQHMGYTSANVAADKIKSEYSLANDTIVVIPDGENGAYGVDNNNTIHHCNSFPPETVVDTNGAGDCFIAAVIYSLTNEKSLEEALNFGCKLAGRKCGMYGFDKLFS